MRALLCLFLLLPGCATTEGTLRARFASENGCPEGQVDVLASDGTRYRVSGCGESTVYVCPHFAEDDARACVEESARPGPGNRDREREREVLPPPDPRIQAR